MSWPSSKRAVVLLAEDDPADQHLARRALQQNGVRTDLHVVVDGQEAMDYLTRQDRFVDPSDSPLPDLILLDLNMPRVDGRSFLYWLQNSKFRCIPTIVLTTSRQDTDILESYNLGCNSFLVKPVSLSGFVECLSSLNRYWFELVTLPTEVP